MITFVPYEPQHLKQMRAHNAEQAAHLAGMSNEHAAALAVAGHSWTGLDELGAVVGCAGLLPQWNGRVLAWAYFGAIPKRDWLTVIVKIRRVFAAAKVCGTRRIEATVIDGFGAGCRLAFALDMVVEGRLRAYGPDGRDHFMYAKVSA